MAGTASKRFINIESATFNSLTFYSAQSAQLDFGGRAVTGSGDGDVMPTLKVVVFTDPRITIVSQDLSVINTMPVGTESTLSWVEGDAANGAGTGALTVSVAQAVLVNHSTQGRHLDLGQLSTSFETYSTDGVTSPFTYTTAV